MRRERLLVVGAGATLEETKQSGNYPDDPERALPVMTNFGAKLFDRTSDTFLKATASYLDECKIPYDPKLLSLQVGDSFSGTDMAQGPIGVFLSLEAKDPTSHNVERLCEHMWRVYGQNPVVWAAFIHGISLSLFGVFSEQFGMGLGKPMRAGSLVAAALGLNDVVLNLNYDIAFDLALKQTGRPVSYAPDVCADTILILKPHGSFNLYLNLSNGNFCFEEPDRISGTVGVEDPAGGWFYWQDGIVPPRLNKSYDQHPAARMILETERPYRPKVVTFWGVGLTDSDEDLLMLYREATAAADRVEFINPSSTAAEKVARTLGIGVHHFPAVECWLASEDSVPKDGTR